MKVGAEDLTAWFDRVVEVLSAAQKKKYNVDALKDDFNYASLALRKEIDYLDGEVHPFTKSDWLETFAVLVDKFHTAEADIHGVHEVIKKVMEKSQLDNEKAKQVGEPAVRKSKISTRSTCLPSRA